MLLFQLTRSRDNGYCTVDYYWPSLCLRRVNLSGGNFYLPRQHRPFSAIRYARERTPLPDTSSHSPMRNPHFTLGRCCIAHCGADCHTSQKLVCVTQALHLRQHNHSQNLCRKRQRAINFLSFTLAATRMLFQPLSPCVLLEELTRSI